MQMSSGWNIIPNPHRAHYDIDQLVFSVNNVDYEYYQAVQNRLIEPAVFDFNNSFDPVYELVSTNAYYLYCYEDNVTVKFIPYYSNEFSPEYETNWKARIIVEQENNDISSVIVGTSNVADSLYNANYDLLKPLHKPFEDVITFSIPMEIGEVTQKLHQSVTSHKMKHRIIYIHGMQNYNLLICNHYSLMQALLSFPKIPEYSWKCQKDIWKSHKMVLWNTLRLIHL